MYYYVIKHIHKIWFPTSSWNFFSHNLLNYAKNVCVIKTLFLRTRRRNHQPTDCKTNFHKRTIVIYGETRSGDYCRHCLIGWFDGFRRYQSFQLPLVFITGAKTTKEEDNCTCVQDISMQRTSKMVSNSFPSIRRITSVI